MTNVQNVDPGQVRGFAPPMVLGVGGRADNELLATNCPLADLAVLEVPMNDRVSRRISGLLVFLLAVICQYYEGPVVHAQAAPPRSMILVAPDGSDNDSPAIQRAIDQAPDRATILFTAGVFHLVEPITVVGKRVRLRGNGPRGENRTEFVGPASRELVPADTAVGLVNYSQGGGGQLQRVLLRGGQNGIVGRDRDGRTASLEVEDTIITNTGRGILWSSHADLIVRDAEVLNTLGNGVSVPRVTKVSLFNVATAVIGKCGFYLKDADSGGDFHDLFVGSAEGCGIFVSGSNITIRDSLLVANRRAGIWLLGATATILDSHIADSKPALDGNFGDGILAEHSSVEINSTGSGKFQMWVDSSARSGLTNLSGLMAIGNTVLNCNDIDIDGEKISPDFVPAQFIDNGGVICGCGDVEVPCQVKSKNLTPPDVLTQPQP